MGLILADLILTDEFFILLIKKFYLKLRKSVNSANKSKWLWSCSHFFRYAISLEFRVGSKLPSIFMPSLSLIQVVVCSFLMEMLLENERKSTKHKHCSSRHTSSSSNIRLLSTAITSSFLTPPPPFCVVFDVQYI